jgi:hypothetical protein
MADHDADDPSIEGVSLVEELRALEAPELDQWISHWETRMLRHRRAGEGYSAWWASKILSAALAERQRRGTHPGMGDSPP